MANATMIETAWVVRDERGSVVLICQGHDAAEVATEWRDRGYHVERIRPKEVHAA
jgi:hypothetical protein